MFKTKWRWYDHVDYEIRYQLSKYIRSPIRAVLNHIRWVWGYNCYLLKNRGDHDWDFYYFYSLLRWKLDRMADCIESGWVSTETNRVTKQIRYAVRLLDLMTTEELDDASCAAFKEKWGENHINFNSSRGGDGGPVVGYAPEKAKKKGVYTTYTDINNEDAYYVAEKEWLHGMEAVDAKKEALKHRLFKHIATYINKWWN